MRPGRATDEDFAFEVELSCFEGNAANPPAAMRACWRGPNCWPRREYRARMGEGRVLIAMRGEELAGLLRWQPCRARGATCTCGEDADGTDSMQGGARVEMVYVLGPGGQRAVVQALMEEPSLCPLSCNMKRLAPIPNPHPIIPDP